jgi:hypothetical protein
MFRKDEGLALLDSTWSQTLKGGFALDDHQKYEADYERIKQENAVFLKEFTIWLQAKGLSKSTVRRHVFNIDFYINGFLIYEQAIEAKDGASSVGMFLGYWFIKKALWSSVNQIQANAISLKKFYTFMYEKTCIDKEQLDRLNDGIKKEIPTWIANMERYDR